VTAQPSLFDPVEGERRKREGIALVESHNPDWSARALAQLHDLASIFPHVTADDLRARMNGDEPEHPNAYGAVFRRAAARGWLEPTDATCRSRRPDAHARRLQVWRSTCLPW
jgi:hypothetical protein